MAGSVNKVILVGRLGKDPELKYTPSGAPVAKFSLATDESFKDKTGEKQNRTEWHNIVAWNKLAEICGEYLTKGKLVYIEGSIRSRQWQDQSGNKRTSYEIIANQMQMLGSRADSERPSGGGMDRPAPERHAPAPSSPSRSRFRPRRARNQRRGYSVLGYGLRFCVHLLPRSSFHPCDHVKRSGRGESLLSRALSGCDSVRRLERSPATPVGRRA